MRQYVIYVQSGQRAGEPSAEDQIRGIELFLERVAPRPWGVIGLFQEGPARVPGLRPQFEAALALVRRTPGAELLVAGLDQLDRRREAIALLLGDRRLRVRAASLAEADPVQLGIFAAMAEGPRVEAAAGGPDAPVPLWARGTGSDAPYDLLSEGELPGPESPRHRAARIEEVVLALRDRGQSARAIARQLNQEGIRTARGGTWAGPHVRRVLQRLTGQVVEGS